MDELFEASSPLARRLAARHYRSGAELVAAAWEELPRLSEAEMVGTLNAHPRIGADQAALSRRSREEQGADEAPELGPLNDEYESRFGFRFVVFVNRRPRSEIVKVLRQRLGRSREAEMREGLEAIVRIAEDRLGR